MTQPTCTIIIPTYNRPEELDDCVRSIIAQTTPPDELVVVDDGNLPGIPLQNECEDRGIACRYLHKEPPGLTASRNAGIDVAHHDVLFFLDDDVVLFPDYVQRILDIFRTDTEGKIGGVAGYIENLPPLKLRHRLRHLLDVFFLRSGFREGRVLPSGSCTEYGESGFPPENVVRVDFLPGGVSAWRREVFQEFRFSNRYKGYGLGEDKDFSYGVSKRWELQIEPRARLYHYESPKMRFDWHRQGREVVFLKYRFFRDHVCAHWWHWPCFYWSMLGLVLIRTVAYIGRPKPHKAQKLRGILSALRDMMRGQLDHEPESK